MLKMIKFILNVIFLLQSWNGTQGLEHTRQALYH